MHLNGITNSVLGSADKGTVPCISSTSVCDEQHVEARSATASMREALVNHGQAASQQHVLSSGFFELENSSLSAPLLARLLIPP